MHTRETKRYHFSTKKLPAVGDYLGLGVRIKNFGLRGRDRISGFKIIKGVATV